MTKNLPTPYQQFIAISRYARWREEDKRRETWDETVSRYFDFMTEHLKAKHNYDLTQELRSRLENAVLNLKVMPSMRALMTAGKALEEHNVSGFNCSYIPIDSPRAFDETMYVLMCGTGVGFSVERQLINKLPEICETFHTTDTTIVVGDSKIGWAKAFKQLISLLYNGEIPNIDYSNLRPAGAKLKTFGGRSSGPEPLKNLFNFVIKTFKSAAGRKLNSLECHDIVCKIGEVVVVGGVRRSALISLSNLSDDRMRAAKTGQWWESNGQRALANNSAVYTEKPDIGIFMKEWLSLYESKSGERGVFNRQAAKRQVAKNGRREVDFEWGTNPCSEIILRPNQFCNLSEVIIREDDNEETLKEKVELATILGTFQSTLTDFKYLRSIWQKNTEEERLLGVSLTGIFDNKLTYENTDALKNLLSSLRETAVKTNKKFASDLGINQSTAITCVKPSGNVSQLNNTASGLHPRFSKYYIRTVRGDKKDPLTRFMHHSGIPTEMSVIKSQEDVMVHSFLQKSPDNAVTVDDIDAIQHLELWKVYQDFWCEHKPSVTIYVRQDEWLKVGSWVYDNFDSISGISFLPTSDHIYQQAPYQEITKEKYEELSAIYPSYIDWRELALYEVEDTTTGTQELACTAGGCEIV